MTNKIIAMFPGQGSQAVGMGKDFYEATPKAKERFQEADEILGFSLSKTCFDGPIEKLTETAITQPALLTVSVIAYEAFLEKNPDQAIVAGCGHSLGEYSALVAAGSLKFSDAVKLVNLRGTYMQDAVPIGHGKMAAVLAKPEDEIRQQITDTNVSSVEIANINAPGQIVLAGKSEDINTFIQKSEGWKIKELQVSAPFHSALMMPAQEKLAEAIKDVDIQAPKFPVFQNIDAQTTNDSEAIRDKLIRQVSGTVRWVDCMQHIIEANSHGDGLTAFEFGPGKVLSGLLKRINKEVPSNQVGSIEDI